MGAIRLLDQQTAAQIAAGEVIERPAAVVKELVENAIDADSRRIEVNVVGGEGWQIVVRDDGCGIAADEVELAFARHATSKISAAEDLTRVTTLGFRGEALPSIAAVAEVEMITRPAAAARGTKIVLKGGEVLRVEPCACAPGTRVTVTDLFYNMPARRKHQADLRKELLVIGEVVGRLALAHPGKAFSLAVNGRLLWQTPGQGDLLAALTVVWGTELARQVLPLAGQGEGLVLRGYAGRPGSGRRDRQRQLLVVNGRPVVLERFSELLDDLYQGMLTRPYRPVALLHLTIPPNLVDVNMHPAKTKVRFLAEEEVWSLVRRSIRSALSAAGPAQGKVMVCSGEARPARPEIAAETEPDIGVAKQVALDWPEPQRVFEGQAAFDAGARLPPLEPIGQLAATYILAQGGSDLYLIDQHAAHERIRYAELCRRPEGVSATQMLAVPLSLTLGPRDLEVFWQHADVFQRLGYVVERFGPRGVLIRGVPAALPPGEAQGSLQELLALAADDHAQAEAALLEEGRKLIACRGAIKANQYLDLREMSWLLEELRRVPQPFTCPHGRPVLVRFSWEELAKAFGRR